MRIQSTFSFSEALLRWYDQHARILPWRTPPRQVYPVWVSEIMLQQTTVATVIPYFHRFMERFPTLSALADASLDDVLHLWQGLGYYSRARSLHACAQRLATEGIPVTEAQWLQMPGIGPYTAAAIASIALEHPAIAVDGNVARLLSRYFGLGGETWKATVKEKATALLPTHRFGDFTQALIEIGALICRPRTPLCWQCPVRQACIAYQTHTLSAYPPPQPKKRLPIRYGHMVRLCRSDGSVLLQHQTQQNLLKGLWTFPTSAWEATLCEWPTTSWQMVGTIKHTFTHFHLILSLWQGQWDCELPFSGRWVHPDEIPSYAMSTLVKKAQKYYAASEDLLSFSIRD